MAYDPTADKKIFSQTADKVVTNTTTETSALSTSGVGNRIIKADILKPGDRIRIHGEGVYSSPLLLGMVTVRVKMGTITVASINTTSLGISGLLNASNKAFIFDCLLVVRQVGTTGKIVAGGSIEYSTAPGIKVFDDLDNGGSEITIDTTQDMMVDVTVQWDAATTSRLIKTTIATIHLV